MWVKPDSRDCLAHFKKQQKPHELCIKYQITSNELAKRLNAFHSKFAQKLLFRESECLFKTNIIGRQQFKIKGDIETST
jgi:hypothetical protein